VSLTTDAQLLAAARTSAVAFRELYERHAAAIHRFHQARTRDEEAALGLTAETFAQAWLLRTRFRDLPGGSAAPIAPRPRQDQPGDLPACHRFTHSGG
jgi:RNA polymerase sigma-70 factor (ECF subfamily)